MLLNTHSYFSLRYGTLAPEQLLEHCLNLGHHTVALTDINNTSACLNALRIASRYNLRVVVGVDFRNEAHQQYVALAKNNEGFEEINRHLSHHLHTKTDFNAQAPVLEHCFVIYPLNTYTGFELKAHEYIGVQPDEVRRLRLMKNLPNQKLVAMPTATFLQKRHYNAHRLLRAIDANTLLSKLPETYCGRPSDRLLSRVDLETHYADVPELVQRADAILLECDVPFEFGNAFPHKNQRSYTGNTDKDFELLKRLCLDGLHYRYPHPTKEITDRIHKELEIIREKDFTAYFLINWDIVRYARSKGYFYVGRGSGANSIVAYLLRITDVDPVELDLYFERFINLYRQNPPDFDLDFSWKDRDDITRYIFTRFANTALLATYNTFQYRAVVRELGKVFGLPKSDIDMLSRGQFQLDDLDHLHRLVLKYSALIQNFPSHLSIHAGGIIISEKPVEHYTATFMPPKGFPTTQFDMVVAEDVGLYKFDILSQRGLGKIKDAVDLVHANRPDEPLIDIHDVERFKQDEKVKTILREGRAIGCFYVESPAMRMLLVKLKVDHYLGLVAASSVIRPGVAKSGMMREYIQRFRFPERRRDAHPVMLEIMPETFGVMVYQEDVIKVAHYFAGLSLAEADVLRRGMSGKYRGREEFVKVQQKFFDNCRQKGYPEATTTEIWRQIESFAGYAFSKGHSASYAVESYQSLYLKAHYPLEYMVATINNFGGFYSTELYVHEARMHGGDIQAPCVNRSNYPTTLCGNKVYLGFIHLHEFETGAAEKLVKARAANGAFADLDDFIDRVPMGIEQVSILIRIGAFRFTGINKRELLWKAHLKLGKSKPNTGVEPLFRLVRKDYQLPALPTSPVEEAFDQMELLGFALCNPFNLLANPPERTLLAMNLKEYTDKVITIFGYLVTAKVTKTSNGKRMSFGTFIDCEGYFFDTVHFPLVAEHYPFRGRGVYILTGRVCEEFGSYSIEVSRMEKAPLIVDPRYSDLRTATQFRSLKRVEESALKREEERKKEVAARLRIY